MIMYGNDNGNDKMRAEREREISTDLLAMTGVEEPKVFKVRAAMILKIYLAICTVKLKNIIKNLFIFIYFCDCR